MNQMINDKNNREDHMEVIDTEFKDFVDECKNHHAQHYLKFDTFVDDRLKSTLDEYFKRMSTLYN